MHFLHNYKQEINYNLSTRFYSAGPLSPVTFFRNEEKGPHLYLETGVEFQRSKLSKLLPVAAFFHQRRRLRIPLSLSISHSRIVFPDHPVSKKPHFQHSPDFLASTPGKARGSASSSCLSQVQIGVMTGLQMMVLFVRDTYFTSMISLLSVVVKQGSLAIRSLRIYEQFLDFNTRIGYIAGHMIEIRPCIWNANINHLGQ